MLSGLAEGFSYAFGFRPIRAALTLLAVVSLVGMPYSVLLPVFAEDILHGGPNTYGFLMSRLDSARRWGRRMPGRAEHRARPGRHDGPLGVLFGAGLIAFSLSHWLWLSLALMAVTGFSMMLQMASCNTVLQTIVEDDKRIRVMAMYTMAFMGTAFGSLVAGFATHLAGAR